MDEKEILEYITHTLEQKGLDIPCDISIIAQALANQYNGKNEDELYRTIDALIRSIEHCQSD